MKNISNLKLFLSIKIFFIFFLVCLKCYAENNELKKEMVVLGPNDAPIKIKVFSSLTCPHCANFHIKVVPKIKKKYIEAGKVQLIFIDFPLDKVAFNASKLLHCLNQKKQITFLDSVYKNQDQLTSGSNFDEINNNLKKISRDFGINETQFDKCLNDEAISEKILNGRIDAQKKYSINSTPTIIINEKKLDGSASFKNIEKNIDKII